MFPCAEIHRQKSIVCKVLLRSYTPDFDGVIITPTYQPLSFCTYLIARHLDCVPIRSTLFHFRLQTPHLDRVIYAPPYQPLSIWTYHYTIHSVCVPIESTLFHSSLQIPYPDRLITAPTYQSL